MELLRVGITSTLVGVWYAAVLTLAGSGAATPWGGIYIGDAVAPATSSFGGGEIVIPRGRSAVVDGRAGDGEWSDALLVPLEVESGWMVDVRVKHDGQSLWVAFRGLRDGVTRVPEVLLDPRRDGGNVWREDDWWLHASYQDCTARGHHNDYSDCTPEHPWLTATNLSDGDRYPEVMEMRIPFDRTGLAAGQTIGVAFNVTDTQRIWRFWPREAEMGAPGSWAVAVLEP